MRYKVALRGLGAFEGSALDSYFALHPDRQPAYTLAATLADADFVVADGDQPAVVDALRRHGRLHDAVLVGSYLPAGARAWTMRPLDPRQVMRELDALATQHGMPSSSVGATSSPTVPSPAPAPAASVPPPMRRASDTQPGEFDALAPRPPSAVHAADALLVDDSDIALKYLERQLHALGLSTRRCHDAEQALRRLGEESYDFVFLDVELGEDSMLDGLALCQRVRQLSRLADRRPPVIVMVSAHAAAVDRVRGTLAGCDAYLAQPLDAVDLRHTLLRHGARLSPPAASRA